MDLVSILIVLIVIGVLLWMVPMDGRIRNIIVGVIVIALVIWLLRGSGALHL